MGEATSQPAMAGMNRQQRRANAAALRRKDYDARAMAEATGLPVEAVEKMPAGLRSDIAGELCQRDTAPALAQRDPVRVAEWINSYTDGWFKMPSGEPIACRAGCAHCCMIVPDISVGEAMILRAAIARLPERAQRQIADDMAVAADAVRAAGGGEAAWPLRCPLLGQDGCCQVYEDRPSACRAWASTDVTRCASGANVPVPLQTRIARVSRAFLADIFRLAKGQPLPLVLERNAR